MDTAKAKAESLTISYFDETIFTFGESLTEFTQINVFNDADAYLLKRQGIPYHYNCSQFTNERSANLNPRTICAGINIYSMNPINQSIRKMVNFNQILVYESETHVPLTIGEYEPGVIYTVGSLSSFESAIMLKYYAVNNPNVNITNHLYAYVYKHFQDGRAWFNYLPMGIIETQNKELLENNQIINVPPLTFSSEAIDF